VRRRVAAVLPPPAAATISCKKTNLVAADQSTLPFHASAATTADADELDELEVEGEEATATAAIAAPLATVKSSKTQSAQRTAVAACAPASAKLNAKAKYAAAPASTAAARAAPVSGKSSAAASSSALASSQSSSSSASSAEVAFARKLRALRARWAAGRQWQLAAPEQRLGHQTATAIDTLLHSKQLAAMHAAARRLEGTTRLSLAACAEAVEAGTVPVLLRLMQAANRSAPYIELVRCCQRVLLHLLDNAGTVRQHSGGASNSGSGSGSSYHSTASIAARQIESAVFADARVAAELLVEQLAIHREREEMVAAAARLIAAGCCSTVTVAAVGTATAAPAHEAFARALAASSDLMRRLRGSKTLIEKRAGSAASSAMVTETVANLQRAIVALDALPAQ
jgi:hypothetical protein